MPIEWLRKLNEGLGEILKNPLVDHSIDWLGDYVMGHSFWRKSQTGGQVTREINPDWLRREASKIFAETHLDENLLREITYSAYVAAGHRVTWFDNWGPDPTLPLFAEPNPNLGEIGPHQWADIRLSLVEEMVGLQGEARKEKIRELGAFITELAKVNRKLRLRRFVRLNYCKPFEGQYRMVQIERFLERRFQNLQEFQNWILSPTGFRQFATNNWARIQTWLQTTGTQIGNGAVALNNWAATTAAPQVRAATTNPAGYIATTNRNTNRMFFGLGRFIR